MAERSNIHVVLKLDYSKMRKAVHDGITLVELYEPIAEHLAKVKGMEMRDDDVILCVFPKSGTHWMYRVVDMLVRGKAAYDSRTLDSTFLGFQPVEEMAKLDSPRIFVTHLPFKYLPAQIKDKCTKIVHVYRNPKAVCASWMIQTKEAWKVKKKEEALIEEFFDPSKMLYGGWFSYMDAAAEFQKNNPDHPLCHVAYEDMKQDPLNVVKALAKFLHVDATEEFCAKVVQACSFDKQKPEEEKDETQVALKFFRKGDTNDWKNHVTVAVNERFDKILKSRADHCPFSAKYVTCPSSRG